MANKVFVHSKVDVSIRTLFPLILYRFHLPSNVFRFQLAWLPVSDGRRIFFLGADKKTIPGGPLLSLFAELRQQEQVIFLYVLCPPELVVRVDGAII